MYSFDITCITCHAVLGSCEKEVDEAPAASAYCAACAPAPEAAKDVRILFPTISVAGGKVGDEVEIAFYALDSVVRINGVVAPTISTKTDPNRITVTIPEGATSGDLTIDGVGVLCHFTVIEVQE